jgi:hypothetical protein
LLNNPAPLVKCGNLASASLFETYASERPAQVKQIADLYYAPASLTLRRPKLGSDLAFKRNVKNKLYLQASAARAQLGMPQRIKKKN